MDQTRCELNGASPPGRQGIASAPDPVEMRKRKVAEYAEKFANPYVAAASGHIDAVISPATTRDFLIHAIQISATKSETRPYRKHGIPPF